MAGEYDYEGDKCSCPCHDSDGVRHVWPCCYYCPTCQINVASGHLQDHMKAHDEEDDEVEDKG